MNIDIHIPDNAIDMIADKVKTRLSNSSLSETIKEFSGNAAENEIVKQAAQLLADKIDADDVAACFDISEVYTAADIAEEIDSQDIAENVDVSEIARLVADDVSASDIAQHLDMSDLAENVAERMSERAIADEIDASRVAEYMDVEDVAQHVSVDEAVVAREFVKWLTSNPDGMSHFLHALCSAYIEATTPSASK
jgi:AraC-like DNA-binding protein